MMKKVARLATATLVMAILVPDTAYPTGGSGMSYSERTRIKAGQKIKNVTTSRTTDDRRGDTTDNFMDSVIYNDIHWKRTNYTLEDDYSEEVGKGGQKAILLDAPATRELKRLAAKEKQYKAKIAAKIAAAKAPKSYFAGGYCRTTSALSVSRSSEFVEMSCLIDFGDNNTRPATVFAAVYPDYKREVLIALPIYASFEDGRRVNVDGIILRSNRTSYNIADWVDSKRIRKLVAESGLAINDVAYRYASAYMTALQDSRVHTKTSYITETSDTGTKTLVPVQSKEVDPPRKKDYFMAAGVEIVSRLFAMFGKSYLYDVRPLFRIGAGKKVWVEGVFSSDIRRTGQKFGEINNNTIQKTETNNQQYINKVEGHIDQFGVAGKGSRAVKMGGQK